MTESDELSFALQERRRRRRIAIVIAVLVLVPVGWALSSQIPVWIARREGRLTADQRAELTGVLDRREALGQQAIALWNAASTPEALAALTLTTEPCPVTLEKPTPFSAGAYVKFGTHDEQFGDWSLCLLRPGATCEATYRPPEEHTALRARITVGEVYGWDLAEVKAFVPPEEPPRTVVVVDQEVPAKLQATQGGRLTFVAGAVTGRAFLYLPRLGQFVCSGALSTENSKTIDLEFGHFGSTPSAQQTEEEGRAALERDLEAHLRLVLPPALRKLGGH